MRIARRAVHNRARQRRRRAQKVSSGALPAAGKIAGNQTTPSTWAQTATIARNKVMEASANASSATARTMTLSPFVERKRNISSLIVLRVKPAQFGSLSIVAVRVNRRHCGWIIRQTNLCSASGATERGGSNRARARGLKWLPVRLLIGIAVSQLTAPHRRRDQRRHRRLAIDPHQRSRGKKLVSSVRN